MPVFLALLIHVCNIIFWLLRSHIFATFFIFCIPSICLWLWFIVLVFYKLLKIVIFSLFMDQCLSLCQGTAQFLSYTVVYARLSMFNAENFLWEIKLFFSGEWSFFEVKALPAVLNITWGRDRWWSWFYPSILAN